MITLLKLKCAKKSEELEVKGSQRSDLNKITTTLNESNCIILTKYRRGKFMNMESCLRAKSQSKWYI